MTDKQIENDLIIGENLKRIRSSMNLSLSEVAKLTSVSKTMLNQIERKESIPTLSVIWRIANGLKIKFDDLLINMNIKKCNTVNYRDMIPICDKSHLAEIYCMVPFSPMNGQNYEFFYCIFHPTCNYLSDGHKNSLNEVIFVYKGTIEIKVNCDTFIVEEGCALTIDATIPHNYINNTSEDTVLCCIVNYGK